MIPKFRAWDKDSKVMRSWRDLILEKDGGEDFWLIGYKENACITSFDHDQILMQSTGLKDKNGVEISEGDVGWDDHLEVYGKVIFDEGKFIYEWENVCNDLREVNGDIEIVGNIYENPELLEVSK